MLKDVYSLSKPQEAIWFTEQYFKNTNINRIISIADFSMKLKNINFDLLKKAINNTVKYHDSFQIRLFLDNGNVKQYFCDFEEFEPEFCEISSVEEFIDEDSHRQDVFNLIESPLYEFRMFKIKGTNTGGLLANFHHIICDGFSAAIFIRDVFKSYMSLVNYDTLPNLNPDNNSYKQYLNSEKEYLNSPKFDKDREYWLNIYKDIPELATIRSIKPQVSSLNPTAGSSSFVLDNELMDNIKTFCANLKISVYNFFMAIIGIYVSKATSLNDFAIGTPILNRTNFKEKNTLGMYISTIPFRMKLNNSYTFSDFVSIIAKDTMSMLRHQKFSYNSILEEIKQQNSSISRLYNIAFSYQITKASDSDSDYKASWLFNHCTNDDLEIHIYDLNDENSANIDYHYNLQTHDDEEIKRIHPRILHIINQVLKNKDIFIKDIEIATDEEKSLILGKFNDTKTEYPKDKNVIELFEEQVKLYPDDNAIFFERKISYI